MLEIRVREECPECRGLNVPWTCSRCEDARYIYRCLPLAEAMRLAHVEEAQTAGKEKDAQ